VWSWNSRLLLSRKGDILFDWARLLGNGYATEAMTALIDYCFNTIRLQRIIALAKPENIAYNRVIQKLGFKFQKLVSGLPEEFDFYNGEPYYLLTKEEYLGMVK